MIPQKFFLWRMVEFIFPQSRKFFFISSEFLFGRSKNPTQSAFERILEQSGLISFKVAEIERRSEKESCRKMERESQRTMRLTRENVLNLQDQKGKS